MQTGYQAKVIAHSKPDNGGPSLITVEATYPRCIHPEWMTHRSHSRNAGSSRAIPTGRMISAIVQNPFVPDHWGKNQKGMQAEEEFDETTAQSLRHEWILARDEVLHRVDSLREFGVHKQIINRLLEPWSWITVIDTANEYAWEHLFNLRCHPNAEPHMQKSAYLVRGAIDASTPNVLRRGQWHLPYLNLELDADLPMQDAIKACVGRCARVSYLTHDGTRDPQKDIELHDRLEQAQHWSPFEHVAFYDQEHALLHRKCGNLGVPWNQYRKTRRSEFNPSKNR